MSSVIYNLVHSLRTEVSVDENPSADPQQVSYCDCPQVTVVFSGPSGSVCSSNLLLLTSRPEACYLSVALQVIFFSSCVSQILKTPPPI